MKILDDVFDLKDKINTSLGRETSLEWNKRMLKEYWEQLMALNVLGLPEILNEIQETWNSGLYHNFMLAFEERQMKSRPLTFEELAHDKLSILAATNLPATGLKSTVTGKTSLNLFNSMNPIIETAYYLNTDRPYTWNDMLNLAFSDLKTRLIFALDKFDELEDVPEPTAEFFQKLKETQMISEQTIDFELKIGLVLMHIEGELFGGMGFKNSVEDYWPTMSLFNQFLAACNAVKHNREEIIDEDIIRAYKTFFKLIKTDVTQYKAIPELVQSMDENNPDYGDILICKNCGCYYKLEQGESINDFESCQCGGELKQIHDKND
jgi:hypothetical protein